MITLGIGYVPLARRAEVDAPRVDSRKVEAARLDELARCAMRAFEGALPRRPRRCVSSSNPLPPVSPVQLTMFLAGTPTAITEAAVESAAESLARAFPPDVNVFVELVPVVAVAACTRISWKGVSIRLLYDFDVANGRPVVRLDAAGYHE